MKSLQIACAGDVIEMWLQRSQLLLDAHSNAARFYRVLHYVLGALVIVLSGVMTFPCMQPAVPYFSSLIVVLASVYVFLGLNDSAERHRRAAKLYGETMRGLELQKGLVTPDIASLAVLQDKINRANTDAPDIPLFIFKGREKAMLMDVGEVEQQRIRAKPRLLSSVSFHSYATVTCAQLTEDHFRLEGDYFGRFASCPSTFAEFRDKYAAKSLILTDAKLDSNLIGFCMLDKLKDSLCHLRIIVLGAPYRAQGIGKRLASATCELLSTQGVKMFSLFTANDATIGRLFRGVADPVSVESELTPDEVEVLSELARRRGLPESHYGTRRVVQKYYTLRDGSTQDATFRLYRL